MPAETARAQVRTSSNFNALRIFAVLIVIYGNGFVLTSSLAPGLWGEPFALVGLHLLFASSGFLLTDSWQRHPNWRHFAVRRARRTLPALAAAVLFTVMIIGPLASRLSLRRYLLNGQTLHYFLNIVMFQQRTLPGVFEGQQWSGSVNPMLWTVLGVSLLAVCVPLAASLPNPTRAIGLLGISIVLGCASWFLATFPDSGWFHVMGLDIRLVVAEAPFFLGGMAWRHLDKGIDGPFRADVAMLCFIGNWAVATWWGAWTLPLLWLTIPYMVACFGRRAAPLLHQFPDIAYGMFLAAFPVQQLIVSRFPHLAHPIAACTLTATLLGIFWLLVRYPAFDVGQCNQVALGAADYPASLKAATSCPNPLNRVRSSGNNQRSNNFDALRIFAALLVIYGHGRDLSGGADPGLWGVPLARIGLDIFFSISGYLVTISWEHDSKLSAFLAKRTLRIFPGLIACVLLTAFLLGPAVSTLRPGDYFSSPGTYAYLANIGLYTVLRLPGVFETLQHDAINGSLWSLFPEWLCYLTVPLFALLPSRLRLPGMLASALICGWAGVLLFLAPTEWQIVFYGASLHYLLVQMPLFLMGGFFGLLRHRVGFLGRPDLCLLFLTLNYGISTWFGWWNLPIEWLTLPYMIVSFGRLSLPGLRRISRFGDYSYGLYLYAFPMQQLVLFLWPDMQTPLLFCVLVTLPPAILSWHLVEKPALRLKPRSPVLVHV